MLPLTTTPAGVARNVFTLLAALGSTVFARAQAEPAEATFYAARVAPIFEQHCVSCHGPEKDKAGLRLDTFEHLARGSENGDIVIEGNAAESELFYRVTLPMTHEDVMPSDGKPLLSSAEIKVIELWINGGASPTELVSAFPDAPALKVRAPYVASTGDWKPLVAQIRSLEKELGVKLAPRSVLATDGLVLRTASAPSRCTDEVLARLEPVAAYIVEAELARTKISDLGLQAVSQWVNLRTLDLTRTAVTSRGVAALGSLQKLERLNLTSTAVDDEGLQALQKIPALQRLWVFETKVTDLRDEAEATQAVGR